MTTIGLDDWTEMQQGQYKSEKMQYDHFLENRQMGAPNSSSQWFQPTGQ